MGLRLPFVRSVSNPTKKYIVNFGGLNYTDNYKEGELQDATCVTSERFPHLSSLKKKYGAINLKSPAGDSVKRIWGDGEHIAFFDWNKSENIGRTVRFKQYGKSVSDFYDLEAVWGYGNTVQDTMVRLGNYLVAFLDENTSNESGNLAPLYMLKNTAYGWGSINCALRGQGNFSKNTLTLSGYTVDGGWQGYIDFNIGDSVSITGAKNTDNNLTLVITDMQLNADESFILYFGDIEFTEEVKGGIEVSRSIPANFQFPIAINNRIWGVSNNIICASALGDPVNWNKFEGLASDSYQVGVDTALEFTGSGEYDSSPILFKEDVIYRMYGTIPANYSLQKYDAPGVMKGCSKSVCKINEMLYYKGKRGVYRYAGGLPVCISDSLGDLSEYKNAVAGEDGRRYYISMQKGNDWNMFVYDTLTNTWFKENDVHSVSFAKYGNTMYYLDELSNLWCYEFDNQNGLGILPENRVYSWDYTFKPFSETIYERKVYSRLYLRLELSEGAWATVYVQHDSKPWEEVQTVKGGSELTTVTVPIRLKKCDKFSIKIEGEGECCLQTLVREYRTAGDK